jgi:AcrR family transcriptional regulator
MSNTPKKRSKKAGPRNPIPRAGRTVTRTETMDRTREALIQAGLELFGEEGLDAPSLDAICERAGYTRGAFYVHFEDRDAFIDAVMERVGLPLLDAVLGGKDDASAPADVAETAHRFLEAVQTGAYPLTRKGGPRPHQLLDACVRSERVRKRYVGLVQDSASRLATIIRKSQRGGSVRGDVDADAVAWMALAAIVGAQSLLELRALPDLMHPATAFLTLLGKESRTERRTSVRSKLAAGDVEIDVEDGRITHLLIRGSALKD